MESVRDAGTGEPREPMTGGRGMVTPEVVEGERERLKDAQARVARIRELLSDLN